MDGKILADEMNYRVNCPWGGFGPERLVSWTFIDFFGVSPAFQGMIASSGVGGLPVSL